MALTKEQKAEIVKKYGENEKDTGSTKVQIAILTARINALTTHLKRSCSRFPHKKRFIYPCW